jgi:hypothetical protein
MSLYSAPVKTGDWKTDKVAILPIELATDAAVVGRAAIRSTAFDLADYFASDNPNLDRSRFLAACKVTA